MRWHQKPTRRQTDERQFHTWWVEQSPSFVQYQPFQLHLQHWEFQIDKLLHNGEDDTRAKKKKKELCPSRDQQRWIYLLWLRQVLPPHRVRLHLKVRGCRWLRGNPTAGSVLIQAHSTQRRLLKCDQRMHTLACFHGKAAEKPVASRRSIFRRSRQSWSWDLVLKRATSCRRNRCPKQESFGTTPCTRSQFFSWLRKSKAYRSDMGTLPPRCRHTHPISRTPPYPWSGKSMEDNLAIPWKILTWIWKFWESFTNTTLRAAVHLGKNYDLNSRYVKNHLWKTAGQLFIETEKLVSGQTETAGMSVIDFPRFEVDVDKLIAQPSLSIFHCQSFRLLPTVLCVGKMGNNPVVILEEANPMVSGQQLFQRIESNWWTTCGIRVKDIPWILYSGNRQSDSTDDSRIRVWTRELHRQDHLHTNV